MLAPEEFTQHQSVISQFEQQNIIIHRGLPAKWLQELLQQPGGGGHFRVDLRTQDGTQPTPVEALIHRLILPHCPDKDLFVRFEAGNIYVRFLAHHKRWVLPSDVAWILGELPHRYHLLIQANENKFNILKGLAENDIDVDYSAGF